MKLCKRVLSVGLAFVMIMSAVGCGSGKSASATGMKGASDNEIITTNAVDQNKTTITIRVEFGAGQIANLEEILEAKFPNVDIVLRHDGSTDSYYNLRKDLEAGVECDFIMSRRLATVEDIADKYLLDLSSQSFVDQYYLTAVDSCLDDEGKLYYLPGPTDVYGIVYDKTMFEENGWKVPSSYSEFVNLIETINASGTGVVPLEVSMMYPDMFQILFNTYSYEDVYAGKDNYMWLSSYQKGTGSMIGHMETAVDTFKKLVTDGILNVDATQVTPAARSNMMYVEHSAAMIIECQNAVTYAENYDTDHEIAMMPFWTSDSEDGDYLYGIPSYYMAINKKSAEESEEKKQILLDIFDYLSTVEGRQLLIGDGFQVSNIKGVSLNVNSFSENIISTIEKGQVINTIYLAESETNKQVERALLAGVADVLSGKMTTSDWLLSGDAARDEFLSGVSAQEESYGKAETTLTRLETAYSMAKMYADTAGTSIGLCFGGGWSASTNGYLFEGDITDSEIATLTPVKEADKTGGTWADKIVYASMTGQQIVDILNSDVKIVDSLGMSPYYVAYGLTVEFNPWGASGERVISCKLADGTDIDLNAVYDVAYFNGSLPDGINVSVKGGSSLTWKEAFTKWISDNGGVVKKPQMTLTLSYK